MFSAHVLFKVVPSILDAAAIDRVEAKLELGQMQESSTASGIGSAPVPRLAQRLTASDENLRQPRRQTWIAQRGLPAAGSRGEAAQRGACARKQACPKMDEKTSALKKVRMMANIGRGLALAAPPCLAILLYCNTLNHGFVYDDR